MFRSRAGDSEVLDKVLCRGSHHAPDDAPDDDPSRDDESGIRLVSTREQDHHHNSHWLPAGTAAPSRYVAYYDAASLYPSSGKSSLIVKSPSAILGPPLGALRGSPMRPTCLLARDPVGAGSPHRVAQKEKESQRPCRAPPCNRSI